MSLKSVTKKPIRAQLQLRINMRFLEFNMYKAICEETPECEEPEAVFSRGETVYNSYEDPVALKIMEENFRLQEIFLAKMLEDPGEEQRLHADNKYALIVLRSLQAKELSASEYYQLLQQRLKAREKEVSMLTRHKKEAEALAVECHAKSLACRIAEEDMLSMSTAHEEQAGALVDRCHSKALLHFEAIEMMESMLAVHELEAKAFAVDFQDMSLVLSEAAEKMESMLQVYKEKLEEQAAFRRK